MIEKGNGRFEWLIDEGKIQPVEVCDGKVYFIGSDHFIPLAQIKDETMIPMKVPCAVCGEVGAHLLGCIMR